jgi:hypothetical protein
MQQVTKLGQGFGAYGRNLLQTEGFAEGGVKTGVRLPSSEINFHNYY